MGLSDEASILHALEATNGDINAALEILLGGQWLCYFSYNITFIIIDYCQYTFSLDWWL